MALTSIKLVRTTENLDQIPHIQNQHNELRDDVQKLSQLKFGLTGDVNRLKNEIISLQNYFDSLSYQYKVFNARRELI